MSIMYSLNWNINSNTFLCIATFQNSDLNNFQINIYIGTFYFIRWNKDHLL